MSPGLTDRPRGGGSRLPQLDGLRGLAAMIVVLSHSVLAFQPAMLIGAAGSATPHIAAALLIAQTPLILFFSPQFGVAIFFVLSGFVLAMSSSRSGPGLAELAVRRWGRLSFPVLITTLPIWLWLATGFHPDLALAHRNHSDWLAMNFTWVAFVPNNLLRAIYQALVEVYIGNNKHWWNTSLWTLQIELWGSLGLFAVYALMNRLDITRPWRLVAAIGVALCAWRFNYAEFAVGAALFETRQLLLHRRLHGPGQRVAVWMAGLLVCVVAMILGGTPEYAPNGSPYDPLWRLAGLITTDTGLLMHRLGAVAIVVAVLIWAPLAALFTTRLFAFLGRISFMVYLCHVSLLCGFASWLVLRFSDYMPYNAACFVAEPLFISAVVTVATLAERWVDRPSIALARLLGLLLVPLTSRKPPIAVATLPPLK